MTSVSIVIPVHARWDFAAKCVSSLRRHAPGAQVIVVDNGSATGPTEAFRSAAGDAALVVPLPQNLNFAGGCNVGLEHAEREYVLFLNDDTRADQPFLSPMVNVLAARPEVGVVGALLWLPCSPKRAQHAGMAFSGQRAPLHLYRGMTLRDAPGIVKPKAVQAVTGAAMMLRTADARTVRGFDGRFVNGFEDVDLCFRARRDLGLITWYEPAAQLTHWEGQTPGRYDNEKANGVIFYERWKGQITPDARALVEADGGWRP